MGFKKSGNNYLTSIRWYNQLLNNGLVKNNNNYEMIEIPTLANFKILPIYGLNSSTYCLTGYVSDQTKARPTALVGGKQGHATHRNYSL